MDAPAILFGAVCGTILASFAAVIALRWPRGARIGGRSRCDGCGHRLGVRELVPILSWLALRGRCARCGAIIDPLHPTMEIAGAAIGGIAAGLLPAPLALAGLVMGIMLLALAALDIAHFWLPDAITGALMATGLAASIVGHGPPPQDALIGVAAGFGILWLIGDGYRRLRGRRGLGGGDPKLFGAIGAWTGWALLPAILMGACLLGLALVTADSLRGGDVRADRRVPLGALLAAVAWPCWLWMVA